MTTIVVLFNLKPGVSAADYHAWAKATDLPTVRGLASVTRFEVLKTVSLLGSDAPPPYDYVELLEVNDTDRFGADIAEEAMQRVAGEFQGFTDNPLFIMTSNIER